MVVLLVEAALSWGKMMLVGVGFEIEWKECYVMGLENNEQVLFQLVNEIGTQMLVLRMGLM